MSTIDRWNQSADAFSSRVETIAESQWSGSTPCAEWTVQELVDHVGGTHVFFVSFLGLPDSVSGWPEVRRAMSVLLATPDALTGTGEIPGLGELPKEAVVDICTNDMLIHTWDLSRAIGADETLPGDLVAACHSWLQALPPEIIRAPGRYGDPQPVASDADAQTKMLAFAGRNPSSPST
jgi:uncharacterized protein (TIGR03086 family)